MLGSCWMLWNQFWSLHLVIQVAVVCSIGYALYVIRCYFAGGVCHSRALLHGKTVIVTGSNCGIGKETAMDMANRGARVILACRNDATGEAAANDIRRKTGNQNVETWKLNLASLLSVRRFAEKVLAQEERLDILINNAGVMGCPQWETEDGFEMQFGVNHLGHFLLTNLLLDLLKKSASSRIINVSSMLHSKGKINFDDIHLTKNYEPINAYCRSKLANVLFTRELHKRIIGTGVTVNAVNPGAVWTNLYRYFARTYPPLDFIIRYFGFLGVYFVKTSEEGAQTTIYCAVEESLRDTSGLFFSDCKPKEPAKQAKDDVVAKKLWDMSSDMVGLSRTL
ncbi:retinol dehydrogenase 13-like [Amphiura filiformis]|uniref:retinol dehydrogenase 13-like n=1 Tax=Amphiura filiformis TaxID=82378 RepID=UPI003B221B59